MQLLVVATKSNKLVVCTTLHNMSLVQHTYLVGILNSRQSVGNCNSCTCLHKSLQCILHKTLALGIKSRCSLIKNKYRWILKYGTRNTYTLALSTRQTSATIAYTCIISLLSLHYKLMCIGYSGSLLHLLLCCAVDTKGNIVAERVVKENSFLIDITYKLT